MEQRVQLLVRPGVVEKVPAGQREHVWLLVAPKVVENRPVGQAVHWSVKPRPVSKPARLAECAVGHPCLVDSASQQGTGSS